MESVLSYCDLIAEHWWFWLLGFLVSGYCSASHRHDLATKQEQFAGQVDGGSASLSGWIKRVWDVVTFLLFVLLAISYVHAMWLR